MSIANEILNLKEELQTAQTNIANYNGKYSMLLNQLKESSGIDDFELVEGMLGVQKETIAKQELELQVMIKGFKERYTL